MSGPGAAVRAYALGLKHKHIPEIMRYTGLTRRPCLCPRWAILRRACWCSCRCTWTCCRATQGRRPARRAGHALPGQRMGQRGAAHRDGKLDALALNDTNKMELRVFRQRRLPPRCADRPAGQPGQGCQRRRGAKPEADAGAVDARRPQPTCAAVHHRLRHPLLVDETLGLQFVQRTASSPGVCLEGAEPARAVRELRAARMLARTQQAQGMPTLQKEGDLAQAPPWPRNPG
jgi:hypothetical protein